MALPVSGPLSLSQINVELGLAANTPISIGQASVRTLAGVPSGPVSFSNLHGKSNTTGIRITSGTDGYNWGYIAGSFGSISPTTIQGVSIMQLVYYPDLVFATFMIPVGARLSGTTVTVKDENGVVIGSWPLSAPYDDVTYTWYFWYPSVANFQPAGVVQYVEVT